MKMESLVLITLLVATARLHAQTSGFEKEGSSRTPPAPEAVLTVLEGTVLTSDGSPAEGAVVASSAGGRAVTGADGWFRLEIELPLGARSAEISAVLDSGERQASGPISISIDQPGGVNPIGSIALVQGGKCQRDWVPTFGSKPGVGRLPGSAETPFVFDLISFDDGRGGGPALYAAGSFRTAGSVQANYVARWDGSEWAPLGEGPGNGTDSLAQALSVYDDGTGPALYLGGEFFSAGGQPSNRIAKWDGAGWSALTSGLNGSVISMVVFDDGRGGGPELYVAGFFTSAGGINARRVARWNGTRWARLGTGLNSEALALAVYDDGNGPALYAGGRFTDAGGVTASRIAKWDGSTWSPLGVGVGVGDVIALTAFDDGNGSALYVGGTFTTAGGIAANRIAKWDGTSWSALGSGLSNDAESLAVFDDGSGPALYVGGEFGTAGGIRAIGIARWDGASWASVGPASFCNAGYDCMLPVFALAAFDDGVGGRALFAGGAFDAAEGLDMDNVAKWDGAQWSSLGRGLGNGVNALAVLDDGVSGPTLFAGGAFRSAGGVTVNSVVRWTGTGWASLGGGVDGITAFLFERVRALTTFDDGGGPALYAGGDFTSAGGGSANRIAKWDGVAWSPLRNGQHLDGLDETVHALTVFDVGGVPNLVVGGEFLFTGGALFVNHVAMWNGTRWFAVGGGVSGARPSSPDVYVRALKVHDDGSGPALYAGGVFTSAGGVSANRIARWNGSSWSALGSGMDDDVVALEVFDDGGGPALYAAGRFTTAGGVAVNRIAKWDGSSWSPVGSGLNSWVSVLTALDDAQGRRLYAGGIFTGAGSVAANRIARWDGTSWAALGSGMDAEVRALAAFDDGTGPDLITGGYFVSAGESGDSYLGRWQDCPRLPKAQRR